MLCGCPKISSDYLKNLIIMFFFNFFFLTFQSIDGDGNSSVGSLPDNDYALMPKIPDKIVAKVRMGGYNVYDASSIRKIVHKLEKQYKQDYVERDVPYHKHMARQFPQNGKQSSKTRVRKNMKAVSSRVSRDKIKFMRMRLKEDNAKLKRILHDHIERLVNLECFFNDFLVRNGQPSIDWRNVWDDDACRDRYYSNDDEYDSNASSMTGDLHGRSETSNDTKNSTNHEIQGEGN